MIQAPPLALSQSSDFVTACYIVAFSLFILGIRQGTHPRTARRGNLIAAAGMAIAIAITLSLDVIGNGALILIGILIGTLVGTVASYRVQMTQMPQMVALFNGVGGGAAALVALVELHHAVELDDLGLEAETFVLVATAFTVLVTGTTDNDVALVVGLVAIVLAAVNMVGGFVVTDRMLQMFVRKKPAAQPASNKEGGA